MLKFIFMVISLSFVISESDKNLYLLNILKEDKDWILIDNRFDSIQVYEKNIMGMQLNALKLDKIVNLSPESIINVITNINNYSNVMLNDDMVSFNLGEIDNVMYGYNHFSIPLPFISDRHYFFKLYKESDKMLSWTLLPMHEVEKNVNFKRVFDRYPDAVYLDYGAGIWRLYSISDNITKVSYSLYMDSGGDLSNYLNDFFNSQSIITLFKGVLKEASK